MAAHVMLYVTVPDENTAKAVGQVLLENREAACVNILPG
ncbi:MAG TPA: divalent-cation tolerance protein CutA, partial [Desulfomicrobiaceae bacterium]|nr:divalent-cation tolerance protein CutA [Desulfomicrobiaceae bacterium]